MKAAVIFENGDPEVLRYEDVPDPVCPDGCVLLDVEAISIEGGDLLARAVSPPATTPHIVGYLCAGTVIEVGAGVESPAVGEKVVALNADGSHAEKRVVPADHDLAPFPTGSIPRLPRAFRSPSARRRSACSRPRTSRKGRRCSIHAGAGGVGMAAIQLAKQAGATVISTASSDEKLERLKPLGLDHGINYADESFVDRVRELTDGRGVDVVLDSVGGKNLVDGIEALAYRGTLVSVGVAARAGSEIEAKSLWTKNNTLRGVYLGGALLAEYPRVHPMIADLIERVADGELHVEIDRSFALAEAAAAHAYLEGRNAFGRVVMVP